MLSAQVLWDAAECVVVSRELEGVYCVITSNITLRSTITLWFI
jgi:hypothetical protein